MVDAGRTGAFETFLLAEYEDLYQNIIHVENGMFSHLTFFTTVFISMVTASVGIVGLAGGATGTQPSPYLPVMFAVLFGFFVMIGRFELRMITELRLRKVKFIEGITEIRRYFAGEDKDALSFLVLPVGLRKAPPFLRTKCEDWYKITFVSLINGVAALIATLCLSVYVWQLRQVGHPSPAPDAPSEWWVGWLLFGLAVGAGVFWHPRSQMLSLCEGYDRLRETRMGAKSEYDLLTRAGSINQPTVSFGNLMSWLDERRRPKDAKQP